MLKPRGGGGGGDLCPIGFAPVLFVQILKEINTCLACFKANCSFSMLSQCIVPLI